MPRVPQQMGQNESAGKYVVRSSNAMRARAREAGQRCGPEYAVLAMLYAVRLRRPQSLLHQDVAWYDVPTATRPIQSPYLRRIRVSHAPMICAPQIAAAVKTRKNPAFFWAPPPFCNKKALLVRPRSGKNEPFRSLGCRFVDRNVALLSHPVPQTAVLYGRTQKTRTRAQSGKLVIQRSPFSRRRR